MGSQGTIESEDRSDNMAAHAELSLRYAFYAGPVSWVGCTSSWHANDHRFYPRVRQHSFMEIGRGIISTAILSLPLIQEGQLSVTGERMCT